MWKQLKDLKQLWKQLKDLLNDLRMSLLNFSFVMIYIIHEMLLLLKNHPKFSKESVFECFFKEYTRPLIFS